MSRLQEFLSRAERYDLFSVREAEEFVQVAAALLASRWNAYSEALRDPHLQKSKASKRAYEEAQRAHDTAHRVLAEAKDKRCGRCKNWTKRPNLFGCAAFKVLTNESHWMFTKDGPPWNNCRRFEPTEEALG